VIWTKRTWITLIHMPQIHPGTVWVK